ncbi:MAG: flavin reductase family protein [Kineosporiaceae bacterium]
MTGANGVEGVAVGTVGVATPQFRRAVGRFATGVCVVSTVVDGLDHAITVNSFSSVSLEPALVLVCIADLARFHDAVLASGQWAVSVLAETARPVADWLATPGRPVHGQLASVPHRRGAHTGAALVSDASAWLECRTSAVHAAGDHSILVGEVLSVELAEDADAPLLYHRGAYRRLAVRGHA